MTAFGSEWPFWQFKSTPEELFQNLDAADKGIALVELPQVYDPQALINTFGSLAAHSPALTREHSLFINDLVYPPWSAPEEALELHKKYHSLHTALQAMVDAYVLPHIVQRKFLSAFITWRAERGESFHPLHCDNNFFTAYLGATASGHLMELPDGTELPLAGLPPHHVLFTRQREWCYISDTLGPGIEHKVAWQADNPDDVRAVGLSFIGK